MTGEFTARTVEEAQAADLLTGAFGEQVAAVASALKAARLQALAEGWHAAVHALRVERARLAALPSMPVAYLQGFAAARAHLMEGGSSNLGDAAGEPT